MKNKILIIAGVVALIVIAVLVLNWSKTMAPTGEVPAGGTGTTGGEQSAPTGGTGNTTGKSPTPIVKSAITVTAPLAGAKWEIGKLNTISWSRAAGVTGIIYLMSAAGQSIGVILPTFGPDQTSYNWDTTYVSVSATNASRINVTPGDYKIRLAFSGNNLPVTDSGVITLLRSGTPEAVTTVLMQNYAFVPNNFTVSKGQKVTFTNKDSVQHHLAVTAILNSMPLNPGESYILDTSSMKAGTYNIYCDLHPDMVGKITVK
ncbi:MAG: hypothetical protein LiPW15_265 [Parcubacteria group bacterium LiPW_15]|nr:MAG: hypothetical protein LiPW15_265 [Parcubacteria group bacterium LiPW_15]